MRILGILEAAKYRKMPMSYPDKFVEKIQIVLFVFKLQDGIYFVDILMTSGSLLFSKVFFYLN